MINGNRCRLGERKRTSYLVMIRHLRDPTEGRIVVRRRRSGGSE